MTPREEYAAAKAQYPPSERLWTEWRRREIMSEEQLVAAYRSLSPVAAEAGRRHIEAIKAAREAAEKAYYAKLDVRICELQERGEA